MAGEAAAASASAGETLCDRGAPACGPTEQGYSMTGVFRLLRLAARCPVCGAAPAQRITPRTVDKYADSDPEEIVGTAQCQQCARKGRLVHYEITASDYQRAN